MEKGKLKDIIKDNQHVGCVWLFVIAAAVVIVYYISSTKQAEGKKPLAVSERSLEIADSIHREELMEDEVYVELLEKYEDLKARMDNISGYVSDAEDAIYDLERRGIDVSEIEDAISNISSECE